MKNQPILWIVIALLVTACTSKPTESPVKSITIKATALSHTTLFRITCETFDKYFPDAKVKNITQKARIDSMVNILANMKGTDSGNEPDIRGRIFLKHENNVVDTVCLGTEFLIYKGVTYETPPELINMVQE